MSRKILYIDMDGVIADFWRAILTIHPEIIDNNLYNDEERHDKVDRLCEINRLIFHNLEPIKDAIESVKELNEHFDLYFLSTPMDHLPESYSGKRVWLERHFGEMACKKLILTHRKDLNIGDFLIDDRIKNGVDKFQGEHIHFGTDKFPDWKEVKDYLLSKIYETENNY